MEFGLAISVNWMFYYSAAIYLIDVSSYGKVVKEDDDEKLAGKDIFLFNLEAGEDELKS